MQLKRGAFPSPADRGTKISRRSIQFAPRALWGGAYVSRETVMKLFSRRSLLASAVFVGLLPTTALFAADKPKTINIDWATYNPVSMLLKEKGWLEDEFKKDGISTVSYT